MATTTESATAAGASSAGETPSGLGGKLRHWLEIVTGDADLRTVLFLFLGAGVAIGLIIAVTAPVADLLGDSKYVIPVSLHGMGALLFSVGATMSLYLGWRLFQGKIKAFKDLQLLTSVTAVLALATIVFGLWIYIYYRQPAGAREYFLENNPAVHKIFFEFKEYMAVFTLPLFVASSFALWKFGPSLVGDAAKRRIVAVAIALGWVFLMIAYILGAAITKLRPI